MKKEKKAKAFLPNRLNGHASNMSVLPDAPVVIAPPVRLDLGCGPNPREGFVGVDQYPFDGKVQVVCDLRKAPWPWADSSVDEAASSHFVEHLTAKERVVFVNELYRVLKPGAGATIIVPHWASCRAYGDPTHQWPPVSEFWFYYLDRNWRAANAPHTDCSVWPEGYNCNFSVTWGYAMHDALRVRNQEYQSHAFTFFKEAVQDVQATFVAQKG